MKQTVLKTWLLLVCLLMGVGMSWADEVTYTFKDVASAQSWSNGVAYTDVTLGNFTFAVTGGGNNGKYYTSDTTWRFYSGGGLTITPAAGYTVTSVTSDPTQSFTVSNGSATISFNGTVKFKSITISYTTSGGGGDPEPTKYTVTVANDIANGKVTASSTIAAEGATVTLTATPATGYVFGEWNVTNASTSTAITVTDNKFTMPAANVNVSATFTAKVRPVNEIFYESFDTNDGTGGNDNQWSGSIASNDIEQDNEGWVYTSAKGAKECAKFGAGSSLGSATTPALGQACNATLTFKAAAWNSNSESTTLKLSVIGGGTVSPTTVTMTKGAWKDFEVNLSNLTADSKVKFEGNSATSSRFFLDEVSIIKTSDVTPEKATPTLSFAAPTYNATMGETFTAPELTNPDGVTVTYASSKEEVATVDAASGAVTLVAPGTTTITASFAGNDTYNAASARYELNVAAVYTVAWSVNGEVIKSESVREGAAVTAPADPEAINGKVFTGWIETATVEGATPAYVTPSETATKNVTYYAVFATYNSDAREDEWQTTALSDLTSSDVFVMARDKDAISTENGTSGSPSAVLLTVSDGKITSTVTDDLKWTLTGNETDGYTFYANGTANYLYVNTTATSGSNTCIRVGKQNSNVRNNWMPNDKGYLKTNDTYTARYLSYYTSVTTSDFRGYVTTNNGAFAPTFYKFIPGKPAYSDYCTILTLPVTFKEAGLGYSTLYSDKALEIPEGVEAYALTKNETTGKLTPTQIEDVIPANTGVMLVTENGGWVEGTKTYSFGYTSETGSEVTSDLKGVTEETAVSNVLGAGQSAYVLSVVDEQIGFYKFAGDNLAANKAYYVSDSAVKGFYVDFTGEQTTGIYKNENENDNRVAFDLTGRRINAGAKGISIVGGKKVIK